MRNPANTNKKKNDSPIAATVGWALFVILLGGGLYWLFS
jgi:hypothetical protein